MLSINVRIDRAQRLVRMLEEDAPRLEIRVAPLAPEQQKSAKDHAAELMARAHAELEKLLLQHSFWDMEDSCPQAAD
jgi:phosphoribosylaminoimidazole carboxylase (NCAIR synthetase)